jgi:hypothetical protein
LPRYLGLTDFSLNHFVHLMRRVRFMKNLVSLLFGTVLLPASIFAATINGTVTTGATGGVGGTPVSGAKVVMIIGGGGGGGGGGQRVDSTTSSATGTFTFTTDTAATHRVQVTMTGYNAGNGTVNVIDAAGAYTVTVNLTAIVVPGSGIVTGTVKKSDSSLVAGARVIISRGGGGGGGGTTADTLTTNAQGVYTSDSLTARSGYTITVSFTGLQTSTRNNITVTTGQVTAANFVLTLPVPPGSMTGTISAAAGATPVAGARVILTRTGGGGGGGGFALDTILTDAAGKYTFDSIPNQTNYSINVSATGFQTTIRSGINVVGGLATVANVAMGATSTDTTGTISGQASGMAGAVLAGARVILSRQGGGGGGGAAFTPDTILTDAQGKFSFKALPAATNYSLAISMAGYQNANRTVSVGSGQAIIADFNLNMATSIFSVQRSNVSFRSHWIAGRLAVEIGLSNRIRTVEVYSSMGVIRHRTVVPAGESRALLPADITPAARVFLRVQD